ncbi:GDSL-type esterase/lipase family protein [Dyadobacter helix]|nr:GDSL-type esterase/lipase family protein [Dyadobacter sp. CECT 9275]
MKIRRSCFPGVTVTMLLLVFHTANGQQTNWDSTARPDVYAPRVGLMKTFRHSRKDIVFLGNSITFWAEWSEFLENRHVKNRGIPGDNSFGVLERLGEVTNGKPAKIFVMIGINDLARNIPAEILLKNFQRIVRRIKTESPDTRIYLQTLLPTNDSFHKMTNHCNKDAVIRDVNLGLDQLAKDEKVSFVDLYSHFADEKGKLKKELTWDGVHLTAEGYLLWAAVLKRGKYLR